MEHTMDDSVTDHIDDFGFGAVCRMQNFIRSRISSRPRDTHTDHSEISVSRCFRTDNTVENYGKEKPDVYSTSGILSQFQDLSLANNHLPSAASSSATPRKSAGVSEKTLAVLRGLMTGELRYHGLGHDMTYTLQRYKKDLEEIRENNPGLQRRRLVKRRYTANRATAQRSKERDEVIHKLENKYGRRWSFDVPRPSQERRPNHPNPANMKIHAKLSVVVPVRSVHVTKRKNGSCLASGLLSMMEDLSLSNNSAATPSSSSKTHSEDSCMKLEF